MPPSGGGSEEAWMRRGWGEAPCPGCCVALGYFTFSAPFGMLAEATVGWHAGPRPHDSTTRRLTRWLPPRGRIGGRHRSPMERRV